MTVKHLDIKTAFLYGDLKETIYMDQPPGFKDQTNGDKVCKLQKSLYGLKQAAKVWNDTMTAALSRYGYKQSTVDPCLFFIRQKRKWHYVLIYVHSVRGRNDGIVIGREFEKRLWHFLTWTHFLLPRMLNWARCKWRFFHQSKHLHKENYRTIGNERCEIFSQEIVWLRKLLDEMHEIQHEPTVLYEDNQSCIQLVENLKFSNRTKHIYKKIHFVCGVGEKKELILTYCPIQKWLQIYLQNHWIESSCRSYGRWLDSTVHLRRSSSVQCWLWGGVLKSIEHRNSQTLYLSLLKNILQRKIRAEHQFEAKRTLKVVEN